MIRFSTAGIPTSTKGNTVSGIVRCKELGLSAMEIAFVKSVYIKPKDADPVLKASQDNDIKLSAHAPYWINCCSLEKQKRKMSEIYILSASKSLSACGGGRVVFHPGFYMKQSSSDCLDLTFETLDSVIDKLPSNIVIGPELMGKKSQFGSLEEIIQISLKYGLNKCSPVIDFGHYNSRNTGILKTVSDYLKVFDKFEDELGSKILQDMHIHFSAQKYSDKGEIKHIPLDDGEPNYIDFLNACKIKKISGTIVCESPLVEIDTIKMKMEYEKKDN